MTRSMSPKRSKTASAKAVWPSVVGGVEGHRLGHVGPGRLGPLHGLGQTGALPAGQYHRPAADRDQPGHDGLGDLGGSSEHEHRLGPPDGVDHGSVRSGGGLAPLDVVRAVVVLAVRPGVGRIGRYRRAASGPGSGLGGGLGGGLGSGLGSGLGLGPGEMPPFPAPDAPAGWPAWTRPAWSPGPGPGRSVVAGRMGLAPRWGGHIGAQAEPPTEVGAQHTVGIDPVPHRQPLVDSGVHGPEGGRGDPRVLGQVDPAAGRQHRVVEVVEQPVRVRGGRPGGRGPGSTRAWGTTAVPDRRDRTA